MNKDVYGVESGVWTRLEMIVFTELLGSHEMMRHGFEEISGFELEVRVLEFEMS